MDDMFCEHKIPAYQVIIIMKVISKIRYKKILEAVKFIHKHEIAHRDLKPRNIMFSKKNDISSVKIIDFGLAVLTSESKFMVI